ncbi:MAG: 50S ribosomal protein L44e [Candidatus Micrarchaeota archaeon]|nr:50S ribosomal protein L44e [Candidatus Micrarchaeota archaeon]
MKFPKEINAYCPKCKKHTKHKVKAVSKGRNRSMAWGNRQHTRILRGYGGKVAGEKTVKKQGKRQRVMLVCSVCKASWQRVIRGRTREKIEIKTG